MHLNAVMSITYSHYFPYFSFDCLASQAFIIPDFWMEGSASLGSPVTGKKLVPQKYPTNEHLVKQIEAQQTSLLSDSALYYRQGDNKHLQTPSWHC